MRLPDGQWKPRVPLDSVVTTTELTRRKSRQPNYEAENRALVLLMQELADPSGNVLQKLADTVLELCEAQSAGISILEEDENGQKLFRWHATAGKWACFLGATMPREISPCGAVLDRNSPLLLSHPERHFPFPPEVAPPISEVLLVPFHFAGEPVGTIWVIAHDEARRFDREDERLSTSLGKFASIAYQVSSARHALEAQSIERERAEATVRESEQRFRDMIDALPTAIYTTDSEGRITHFNRAAVEFSGRVPELGSDRWCVSWKMFRSDGTLLPRDQCPMALALQGLPVPPDAEVIAERPDGTRIWFTPFPTAIRDGEGRITGGINMLLDITKRKNVEESQAYLAAIVESSDDAIIGKDLNGIITSWNQGAERLFGYTAQEAIGRSITMLIPAERLDEEVEILTRIRRGERVEHFETVRVRKDGSQLGVSLTISPVKDSAGHAIGISKIARDITERKRVEETLRDSEERFRTLADNMTQLAWMADSGGWIYWYNQRWYDYTGTTPEEMKGWGWQKVHHPAHVARVVKKVKACFEGNEVWEDTFPLRGKDGEYRWFLMRAVPIKDRAGKVLRWLGTNTDITEQRNMEQALRESTAINEQQIRTRTQELVERNAEVLQQSEQLRALSHRLMQIQDDERRRIARDLHDSAGQYLAALGMSIEAARRHAQELPNSVPRRDVMLKLDEASEITDKCSSEIRTLSYLLHPPLIEELGLTSAINWYVEGFAKRGDVQVTLQMPQKLKRMGDDIELALFRVLQECLTNIHRHSGSKTATLKVEADEHRASLEVSDQGTGIPKAAFNTRKTEPRRTGVGISGMRERLKDLGGTLEIDSSERGTTVRAIIPLRQPPQDDN